MFWVKKFIRTILHRDITVEMLRKWGAVVGEDVELYDFVCSRKDATCLKIGNHVTLSGVHVITHDASTKRFLGHDCNRIGRVVVGDNVFVGINTVILPNVRIGNNVIVGACSLVNRDVPSNCIVGGGTS